MTEREQWGSRIGLILAMAGNAIGLGNFLRFPVQAAQNGGGAFMIPYFVALILLAVPLMWVEWAIGRRGGRYSHGSLPGMFDVLWNHPVSKYIGILGLFVSTIIMIYYTYIESWTLGFSFFSIFKTYFGMETFDDMKNFLTSYQGTSDVGYFDSILPAYFFLLVTFAANFYILSKGITKGIEKFAKIALPLLILFAVFLAVWTLFLGTPDPVNYPERNIGAGFAFLWNPNFDALSDSQIWLAAAGQVFFTLSVGMGTLQAYASYLKKNSDIALNGLATASVNEFAEVILGSSIAIPIAVAFFGIATTQTIATGGAFNLGFVSMPIIFHNLPFGNIIGFIWFFLLFFAGITSSVAMSQPLISFLKEQFNFSHKKATYSIGLFIFICIQFVVFFNKEGFLDELDYWAGTFFLVIVAFAEVIIFAWIFGMKKGWAEINEGADIKIPKMFYYVIKYITPVYLLFLLVFWTYQDAIPTLLYEQVFPNGDRCVAPEYIPYRWGARVFMILILVGLGVLVRIAWKRNKPVYDFNQKSES